ncbi:MAG: serpin family protein [Cyanobacteriota bacterium]
MKKILSTALILSVVLSTLGCKNDAVKSTDPSAKPSAQSTIQSTLEPLTDKDKKITSDDKVVQSNNKFAFKIYSELLKKEGNIFISPTSILFCLSMIYNAADGKTKEEMEKVLEFTGSSLDEINKANNTLMRQLSNVDAGVKLNIANSLWGNKSLEFSSDFKKNMSDSYKAEISSLDFSSKKSVDVINEWVKNSTNSKISKIIDSLSEQDLLVLINAIYFKGTWTNKFEKELTKDISFKGATKTKDVPMMSNFDDYKYVNDAGLQGIELPYGKENISMFIFLPGAGQGIADLNKNMTSEKLTELIGKLKKKKGKITMPKFKLEYEASLNDALSTIGMSDAFSDSANLSKLFAKPVTNSKISQVKHKTFIDVNEEGTEAAAVTAGTVTATSIMIPEDPFEMNVDSPFFYVIRDKSTQSILFMGSIFDL